MAKCGTLAQCEGIIQEKQQMIARLRTQHLASPDFRGELRGKMWARERATYDELKNLDGFYCSVGEEDEEWCFAHFNGVDGLGAVLFFDTIRPKGYGDRAAAGRFWRGAGYKKIPCDREVQYFADAALEEWKAAKAEV